MTTSFLSRDVQRGCSKAFTLVEVMISVAVVVVSFISLYSGISMGFAVINVARENLRATQILQEKMETMRLYNWDQINTTGFVPATFAEPFYPKSATNSGLIYSGTLQVIPAPVSENYSNDMRLVVLNINWMSGHVARQRQMQTYVSRHGLQNYIY